MKRVMVSMMGLMLSLAMIAGEREKEFVSTTTNSAFTLFRQEASECLTDVPEINSKPSVDCLTGISSQQSMDCLTNISGAPSMDCLTDEPCSPGVKSMVRSESYREHVTTPPSARAKKGRVRSFSEASEQEGSAIILKMCFLVLRSSFGSGYDPTRG